MGAAKKIQQASAGDDVEIIRMPVMLDKTALPEFESNCVKWMDAPESLIVFDFADTVKMDQHFFRSITVFRRGLLKNGKHLASVNLREELNVMVERAGLSDAFNVVTDIEHAKRKAGLTSSARIEKAAPPIDSNILGRFIEATLGTLKIQCNMEASAKAPFIKNQQQPGIEIAGVISVDNGKTAGSIALCFPASVFLGVYESMVGEKHGSITQEIQDGAGELLNIIYGNAKAKLVEQGMKLNMAIPVVVVGEKLSMHTGEPGRAMIVPFECKYGAFHIEVSFKKV